MQVREEDLTPMGWVRLFIDPHGRFLFKQESVRRGFAGDDFGAAGFGADDSLPDDSFHEDDMNDEYDDDMGYDDDEYGYDDMGELELDDEDDFGDGGFGAGGMISRLRERGQARRSARQERRSNRRESRQSRRSNRRGSQRQWAVTILAGEQTLTGAGTASVSIRPQHDFIADDLSFADSLAGAEVTSIHFGDKVVFSNASGIPVTLFGTTSYLRGLLKGQKLPAGLDITVNGTLTGAGDFKVQVVGKKPAVPC